MDRRVEANRTMATAMMVTYNGTGLNSGVLNKPPVWDEG
jgi:hypothetical protein